MLPYGPSTGIVPKIDRSPDALSESEIPRLECRKMECLERRSTKELTWLDLNSIPSVNLKSSFVLRSAETSYSAPPPARHTEMYQAWFSSSASGTTEKEPLDNEIV